MSDPYNTADSQPVTPREATPQPAPVRQSASRRGRRGANPSTSAIGELLPVWNVLAMLLGLIWAVAKGSASAAALVWIYCPLILAVISCYLVTGRGLVNTIRVLNALLAAYVMFRLLRYASVGIFTANMLVMFATTVFVPVLNVIYLRPRQAD